MGFRCLLAVVHQVLQSWKEKISQHRGFLNVIVTLAHSRSSQTFLSKRQSRTNLLPWSAADIWWFAVRAWSSRFPATADSRELCGYSVPNSMEKRCSLEITRTTSRAFSTSNPFRSFFSQFPTQHTGSLFQWNRNIFTLNHLGFAHCVSGRQLVFELINKLL